MKRRSKKPARESAGCDAPPGSARPRSPRRRALADCVTRAASFSMPVNHLGESHDGWVTLRAQVASAGCGALAEMLTCAIPITQNGCVHVPCDLLVRCNSAWFPAIRSCPAIRAGVETRRDPGHWCAEGRLDRRLQALHLQGSGHRRFFGLRHRPGAEPRRRARRQARGRADRLAQSDEGFRGGRLRHRHGRRLGHARSAEEGPVLHPLYA